MSYLEVRADIPQLALQEKQNVLVVLTLLVRFWVQPSGKGLEISDILVEAGQILLDDEGQLVHLDRVVVKEGSLLGQLSQLLQFAHSSRDSSADFCRTPRKL